MGLSVGAVEHAAAGTRFRFACYRVVQGDSASQLSLRLTRKRQSWRTPGFQILDTAAGRFIPKADYARILPGWQACVDESLTVRGMVPSYRLSPGAAPTTAATAPRPRATSIGIWALSMLCVAACASWVLARTRAARARVVARTLEKFGAAFIQEFERPLVEVRGGRTPPLRAELDLRPFRRSLDVLLAPNAGYRYPNLTDHRTNVEYDVRRVMSTVNDPRFVSGPPEARGDWVKIPIRLVSHMHKEGGA